MKNIGIKSLIIGVLLTFSVLATSCSSIEARSKGAAKPFPGIRFMSDSRHSVYGAEGWMAPKPPEPKPKTDDSCDWVMGIAAGLTAGGGTMSDEDVAFVALWFYAPIDFTATLTFDLLMWPADALDNKAKARESESSNNHLSLRKPSSAR